jgi:purine-cytosine permease-like protein
LLSTDSIDSKPSETVSNEFEREPVPQNQLKGANKFWGMYAGEHCAGTEFMIGPLFLLGGVSLHDIFLGLLLGNLLAVLSWRFVCAPIATKARLTLYFHLEKIAGKWLVVLYNLANGILFCFLAGAMITISATAIGIPFNIPMPTLESVYPNSLAFVVIVLAVGAVIAIVAAKGYDTVAKFANIASPWMILVFIACGIVAFKQLEVSNWAALNSLWKESIVFAQNGNPKTMSFWSVVFFGWFCNAAMHFGMSDLSIFRYAKEANYGWATAAGMYVGHYLAWIAAAFMLAAQIKLLRDANPVPGPMAYSVAGIAGIICVIVAGWTTANPTIYRAGLAFQAIIPKASRFKVTLFTGFVATVAGTFPAFAWKLLGFVGLYGTILAPMGAIIFFDWYFRRNGNPANLHKATPSSSFNISVFLAWLIPVSIAVYFIFYHGVAAHFFPLPCWIASGLMFLALNRKSAGQTPEPLHVFKL